MFFILLVGFASNKVGNGVVFISHSVFIILGGTVCVAVSQEPVATHTLTNKQTQTQIHIHSLINIHDTYVSTYVHKRMHSQRAK